MVHRCLFWFYCMKLNTCLTLPNWAGFLSAPEVMLSITSVLRGVWSFSLTMHDVGWLILAVRPFLVGTGPGVCLVAPFPNAELGDSSTEVPAEALSAGWGGGLQVPARTGQPQASKGLNFCNQEVPALARVTARMCPGFLLKSSKWDFSFFLKNTWWFPAFAGM